MAATDAFQIHQPELEDLEAARDAWLDGRLRHPLAAGTTFWRVLRADNEAQALTRAEECFPSDGLNRFSPVMASTTIVPSAYAGATADS